VKLLRFLLHSVVLLVSEGLSLLVVGTERSLLTLVLSDRSFRVLHLVKLLLLMVLIQHALHIVAGHRARAGIVRLTFNPSSDYVRLIIG